MSLIPTRRNLSLWKGATYKKRFTLHQGGEGSPVRNLTGYSAALVILERKEGPEQFVLSTENDRIILGGAAGTIDLFISDEDTTELDWDTGVYDLKITSGAGDTDALLWGTFNVKGIT